MTNTAIRNSATLKQADTWLIPKQINHIRDACLAESFATYLQDRNETIIVILADTGPLRQRARCLKRTGGRQRTIFEI